VSGEGACVSWAQRLLIHSKDYAARFVPQFPGALSIALHFAAALDDAFDRGVRSKLASVFPGKNPCKH